MKRLLYRFYRFVSTTKYRLDRRFTRAGLLAVIGLGLTAGMGVDTEQAVAYQAFAFLFCLLAVAMVSALGFRARFTVRRILPRFGTAGAPLAYRVAIQNHTGKVQSGLTLLEDLADPRQTMKEFLASIQRTSRNRSFRLSRRPPRRKVVDAREAPLPSLPPNDTAEARLELVPLRRGPLRFTGATIARADPFGLFRAFITVPLAQTVVILPQRYFVPSLALPGSLKYQRGGVALANSVGESEEFVALRDYRRGDPLRHIHWKSWAKTGKPIVKEFQDEFFVRHALILDTFTEPDNDEVFEEAVSVAASFACAINTQESLLDLMFVGPEAYCFTTGRGLAHLEQMLEILASVQVCQEKPFAALRHLVVERVAGVSGCVCVFLTWDAERQELVRQLKVLGLPMRVLVVVEAGQGTALDPGPLRDQPECFHVLEAGKIGQGLARMESRG